MDISHPDNPLRRLAIINKKQLRQLVPYHPTHLARKERNGTFPKRVRLGDGRVGWLLIEIEAWILLRLAERKKRDPDKDE